MSKFKLDAGWDVPTGLTRKGRLIAYAIRKVAMDNQWSSGGQKVFWSPAEWRDKGERWVSPILNMLHEGGDHAPSFSLDYASWGAGYEPYEKMVKVLQKHDVYYEQYFTWAGGVYD
ncbi:MAG: hypothetical protein CMA07_04785 [Euryarchaeota archaeon]|nr:hypothetical protein [Euryarchaeota archaeon]|tara:strand:- start:3314 stop:3661 length:348 start_codon:yes stop_codon:yes gene_type:complete